MSKPQRPTRPPCPPPTPGRIPASLFGQAHGQANDKPRGQDRGEHGEMRWHGESRGAALVAAGALDGAPEPAGQCRAAEDELLIHTRSSLICWSLCGNQEVSRGHFDLSAPLGAETGPRPRRASPPAPARPAPTAARPANQRLRLYGRRRASTCSPTDMNTSSSDVAVTETSTRPSRRPRPPAPRRERRRAPWMRGWCTSS